MWAPSALVSGEIARGCDGSTLPRASRSPTACALGVLVGRDQTVSVAGGYLIQLLPGAPDALIDRLEAGIRAAGAVTPHADSEGLTPEADAAAACWTASSWSSCENHAGGATAATARRERVTSTLIAIGRKDLEEIVARRRDPCNLECQFCDQVYTFTPEEISDLLKEI